MKALLTLSIFFITSLTFAWDNNSIDNAWQNKDKTQLQSLTADNDEFTSLYAHYRLAMLALYEDDKKTAKKSLDTIRQALKDDYQSADEAALFAAALGQSIAIRPWQATFIAADAEEALDYSLNLSTEHASTLMVKGIAQFNTPALLGGDKAEALALFKQANALFENSEAWGYEDALLWQAKAEYRLGDESAAEQTLARLLEKYPNYYEARELKFE